MRPYLRVEGGSEFPLWQVDVSQCQPWLLVRALRHAGYEPDKIFVDDVKANRMYSRFAAAIDVMDRDAAKRPWVRLVFGYPRKFDRTHRDGFKKLYPATWHAIEAYAKEHPHRRLCAVLQRHESDTVVRSAAAMFADLQPDVFVYPLHDALIVQRDQVSFAEWCLTTAFETQFGEVPKFTRKPFATT